MKSFVILALVSVSAGAALSTVPGTQCLIPVKYAVSTPPSACTGPATGYLVEGYCQAPSHPFAVAATVTRALTAANAPVFSSSVTPLPSNSGCHVPGTVRGWNTVAATGGFVQSLTTSALECLPIAGAHAYDPTVSATPYKGATITCDEANQYYVSAGVEGSAVCVGAGAAAVGDLWVNAVGVSLGTFTATWNQLATTNTATWESGSLTCSRACTIPSPWCADNSAHVNTIWVGTGLVAGTCFMRPATTATVFCRSNPNTAFTATCTAAVVSTDAGVLSWSPSTPNCGAVSGASTNFYTAPQATGFRTFAVGAVTNFQSASGALTEVQQEVKGQWGGGSPRLNAPFLAATTYDVAITGCAAGASQAECVQNAINWFRCKGLTIDASTVCYANVNTRIACPTFTNGFRCPSSSKKGLLGLLGLIGIAPALLCCSLLCLLLLCLCRRKKTEGDVHFATFDPHAVGGSFAPGTACYAPSIGGIPTAVY